jgi:hypothetical protein
VSLGNAEGGGDSMPVVVPWTPPEAFEGVSVADLAAVQRRLGSGEWRSSDQTDDWAGYAVAEVMCLDVGKPHNKKRIKKLLKTWIENGALRIENRKDHTRQPRPFVVVGRRVEGDD